MTGRFVRAPSPTYEYPLLLKQLWHTPLVQAPESRDRISRLDSRIASCASELGGSRPRLGVSAGDTVDCVLDWDSDRFLEAYFAVPMMGAVLQTVNVRLSPELIAHTIDHAGSSVLLVNDEFVPTLEGIRDKLPKVKRLVLMSDRGAAPAEELRLPANMRNCYAPPRPTTVSQTSTRTLLPPSFTRPGLPAHRRVSLSPIDNWSYIRSPKWPSSAPPRNKAGFAATMSICRSPRCFTRTGGGFRGQRRFPASSKCIRVAMTRLSFSS